MKRFHPHDSRFQLQSPCEYLSKRRILRESGLPGIMEVYDVVLETDASLSAIGKSEKNTTLSMVDVGGLPPGVQQDADEAKKANNL